MKVYLINAFDGKDYEIVGVFSTEIKALEWIKESCQEDDLGMSDYSEDDLEILPFDVQ